jgi:hypothetical protein
VAGRRVIDKTGLTEKYDFAFYYDFRSAGGPPGDDDPAPFDVVVVDHAEKPVPELVRGDAKHDPQLASPIQSDANPFQRDCGREVTQNRFVRRMVFKGGSN